MPGIHPLVDPDGNERGDGHALDKDGDHLEAGLEHDRGRLAGEESPLGHENRERQAPEVVLPGGVAVQER